MITSTHNPRIQWVRKLQGRSSERQEAGAFIIEGVRLAEEALASGSSAQLVLYTAGLSERGRVLLDGFTALGAEIEEVSEPVLKAASSEQHPQGILVVLPLRSLPLPENLDFVFIPDGVRDPGNLGTMLRTASAAGVQSVLLPPGTVDPFSPKVVRAAMGVHFRLPLSSLTWDEIRAVLERHGLHIFVAAAHQGDAYTACDFRQPVALIVGGEAEGASPAGRSLAAAEIHIPMPGGGESLNAAAAAAILLFETARQRGDSAAR